MNEALLKELVKATRAMFLMQLEALGEQTDRRKPEIVLARAGYGAKEIAQLLNKKPEAVAKAIQRAGKS